MDGATCSSKWPRYALYGYATLSALIGLGLVGGAIYGYVTFTDIQDLFNTTFKASVSEDFNMVMFIFVTTLVIGTCMAGTSTSLAVYGAYRMNKSCIAGYITFLIFGFVMSIAVGLVVVTHEPQFITDIDESSAADKEAYRLQLDLVTKATMITTLSLAAFQMVGVMLSCCIQKAIQDINKLE